MSERARSETKSDEKLNVTTFFLSFFPPIDTYQFLVSSLDDLCTSLKSKVKVCDLGECSECECKEEGGEGSCCSRCSNLQPVRTIFPHTTKFIEREFGMEHLPLLLKKQVCVCMCVCVGVYTHVRVSESCLFPLFSFVSAISLLVFGRLRQVGAWSSTAGRLLQ